MHLLSKKALREFWERYPDSQMRLRRWFKLITKNSFRNFTELRAVFSSADLVDNLIVFNIGGNKYRLVASIHFNQCSGVEVLKLLMEEHQLEPADMSALGPPDIVLEILNGERDLTVTHIHALAETFQVPPAVFV